MNEVAKIKNGMFQVATILLLWNFFLLLLYSIEEGENGGWWFTSLLWISYTIITMSSLLLSLLSIKLIIYKLKGV